LYPYAGIPWYSAPFGRDGLITAYQLLPWAPQVAQGVLDYVWRHLGTKSDSFTDESPGKVFHEMRRGEMAATREVPFIPYFGSVDSTPLALILLDEYMQWTGDFDRLRQWWPAALRALEWIERWGDPDQDGFLEYERQSPTGLVNQGWKDSHDSVMHADGTLAQAPIRLCEVQAYAFRARMAMSRLARALGQRRLADRLRMEALKLRSRFRERFWNSKNSSIHLAIDGQGRPCEVRSSNMGHALWGGIVDSEQAALVTRHLLSDALFSGYGIRTLADTEHRYNPLSYHNGSVWPHDNSLILEGFRNYGLRSAIATLSSALLGVLDTSQDFRLPELFCGFRKRSHEPPVPYQVACKPQAWSAGSLFLMLKVMLGIAPDPEGKLLVLRSPVFTTQIDWIEIRGLKLRESEIDLRIRRAGDSGRAEVLRSRGDVRVLTLQDRHRL
jgi:glycogen debranching enzyme